jgi:hypothetical protein
MMKITMIIMLMLPIVVMPTSSEAGWLIYHEPIFDGKILDIDTKQPIEGAVVVVEYNKATMGLGAGSISSIISLRETLTDKEGNFHIPSYSTLIQPFSWQIPTTVIIFKPGYASLELGAIYFTGKQIQEKEGSWPWSKELKYKLHGPGIVELPKIKTSEDLIKRTLGFPTGFGAKELPHLYKAYGEEKNLFNR